MSIHIIGEVWDHSRSSGTARLVLLALADNANRETRVAWPSKRDLAERTRVSERSVQRALRELERLEEIELVKAGGPPDRAARYRIVPQPGARGQSDPTQDPSGDTAGEEWGQPGPSVETPTSPEPLTEPKGEPEGAGARAPALSHRDLDAVLAILETCPRFDVGRPGVRVGVENALALHPDASPIEAARVAVVWA